MSGTSSNAEAKRKGAKGETTGSGKRSLYTPDSSRGSVSWSGCSPDYVVSAVDAITEHGDAILFARSMDGGVLVITVCEGQERFKFYARTVEEMDGHLKRIADAVTKGS